MRGYNKNYKLHAFSAGPLTPSLSPSAWGEGKRRKGFDGAWLSNPSSWILYNLYIPLIYLDLAGQGKEPEGDYRVPL